MSNDLEQINKISELAISKGLNPDMLQDCAEKFGPGSPPVLGCMVALVREAWGDPCIYARQADIWDTARWAVYRLPPDLAWWEYVAGGTTETEALRAALEAAP